MVMMIEKNTMTLECNAEEASLLVEGIEALLAVHMGTDRFARVALVGLPMLEQLTGDRS